MGIAAGSSLSGIGYASPGGGTPDCRPPGRPQGRGPTGGPPGGGPPEGPPGGPPGGGPPAGRPPGGPPGGDTPDGPPGTDILEGTWRQIVYRKGKIGNLEREVQIHKMENDKTAVVATKSWTSPNTRPRSSAARSASCRAGWTSWRPWGAKEAIGYPLWSRTPKTAGDPDLVQADPQFVAEAVRVTSCLPRVATPRGAMPYPPGIAGMRSGMSG